MTSTRELKAKFTADTTQFNQQIKAADSAMKLLANQTRLLDAQMKSDGATTDMLEAKKKTLTQSLEQNRAKQEALRAKVEEAKKSFGDESIEVERLSTQLATAKRNEVELASDLASTNTAIDRQKNAFSSLEDSIAKQESKIDRAKTAYKALVVQYGEGSDKAQKVAQSIKRMDAELDESRSKMAAAEAAADKLGNEVDEAGDKAAASAKKYEAFGDKAKSAGEGMANVGRTLTGTVTTGIVAAGAATVVAATDMDTALTGVKKTVDGTEAEYQALKEAAIEFSQTNAVSPSQILDIQALGAQLGFGIDELSEFGEVVSGLDIATNMSADQAATEMAQFANITKMAHEDVSRYGSAIVGLGNNFATTESSISSMAMRIAAAGKQVGMSQADILGLSTALSSMGVEAEAGGTAISTIIAEIDKSVAKGSDGLKQWAEAAGMSTEDFSAAVASNAEQFKGLADSVGMTVKEFQSDVLTSSGSLSEWAKSANMDAEQFAAVWKDEPVDALSAVLSGLEGATTEGSNMSLMLEQLGIVGIRQTDIMKRLAGNSEFVGKAVAKSNEEWEKNDALGKEVENRNDSLAAKFEILKNRVVAIADDIGGPLADSLLAIVDDAEPLIKTISDGAKAFNDMSKEEQQSVLKTVALAAALGPMLSIAGNGVKTVGGFAKGLQKLAGFFASVDVKTRGAAQSMRDWGDKSKTAQKAADKSTESVKKSSAAMGLAKSAAAGLALAGIALVVTAVTEYVDRQKKLKKATDGLKDSLGAMDKAFLGSRDATDETSSSADGYAKSLSEVRGEVDRVIDKQAELAESINESFTEAGNSIGMLESYKTTIEELAGKSELSSEKQGELRWAVKGVSDMLGESYEVVEGFGGAYVIMKDGVTQAKDAVVDLIEAQERQIRFDAKQDAYEQSYKNQAEAAKAASDATAAYNKFIDEKEEKLQAAIKAGGDERLVTEQLTDAEGKLKVAMDEANGAYSAANDAVSSLRDEQALLSQAMSEGKGSMSDYVSSNDFLLASLQGAGKSCLDFSGTLQGVGASVTDLKNLNEQQLSSLATSYDGTYSSIASLLSEYGVNVDEAKVKTQQSFDKMKNSMSFYSDDVKSALFNAGLSADDFAGKLADAGVSVKEFRSLSSIQLAQLVESYDGNIDLTKAKLDEFVQKNGEAGADGASSFASSLSEGAYDAVLAASQVTGMTLGQFETDCSKYGIKGVEAVTAYATAISNGATPAQAAAVLMGTAGAAGADQSGLFDASAKSNLDSFNAKLGGAAGSRESGASAASAGAGGAGSQGAGYQGAGASMLASFNAAVARAAGSRSSGSAAAREAADGMKSQNGNAGSWGNHLVQNFASGIRGMVGWARSAASAVAGAVANILGHTVPKEGPLSNRGKGEAEWGGHAVQNFAKGMESKIPDLEKTVGKVSETAAAGMRGASLGAASLVSDGLGSAAMAPMAKASAASLSVAHRIEDAAASFVIDDGSTGRIVAAIEKQGEAIAQMRIDIDGKPAGKVLAPYVHKEIGAMQTRGNR